MNDEINMGTMTLDSSPKTLNPINPVNFYRLNNSGLSNEVINTTLIVGRDNTTMIEQQSLQSIDQYVYTDDNAKLKPNTGLRITKVQNPNAKKQSIQRIYDNKNVYKPIKTKSTQRGGRKSFGPQAHLNTIQATTRVSQSHTRGGMRMQTLRPLEPDVTKSGMLMHTIYDTQQPFINSYGQVSMKSLSIRDQGKKPQIRQKSTQRQIPMPAPAKFESIGGIQEKQQSKKKLKSIVYMDESKQNQLVQSVTIAQNLYPNGDNLITIKPPNKSNNMSKLDHSRMTHFSQQSPIKFGTDEPPIQEVQETFQKFLRQGKNSEMETALAAAIQQDQQVLEDIKKDWTEVNKRIQKRANLLQTLQNDGCEYNPERQMSIKPSQKNLLYLNDDRRLSAVGKSTKRLAKQEQSPDQKQKIQNITYLYRQKNKYQTDEPQQDAYSRKRTIEPRAKVAGKELMTISHNYKSNNNNNNYGSRNRGGSRTRSRGQKGMISSFKESDQALNSIQIAKNTINSNRIGMSKSTLRQNLKTIPKNQVMESSGRMKHSLSRERCRVQKKKSVMQNTYQNDMASMSVTSKKEQSQSPVGIMRQPQPIKQRPSRIAQNIVQAQAFKQSSSNSRSRPRGTIAPQPPVQTVNLKKFYQSSTANRAVSVQPIKQYSSTRAAPLRNPSHGRAANGPYKEISPGIISNQYSFKSIKKPQAVLSPKATKKQIDQHFQSCELQAFQKNIKVSQVLKDQGDSTPFDLNFEYQQMFDDESVDKKKLNKIIISQIIEKEKKSDFMSINDAMQQNFNENLEKSKQGPNETINSSNLVMNHRDRQNIKEFLSANHSQMGLTQIKVIEDAKNTSANPLLNDSINRSQQSGHFQGNRASIYGKSRGSFVNQTNHRYTNDENNEENNAIEEVEEEEDQKPIDDEMVEEIPLSDHDQTKENILISEDQFFQKPDLTLKKPPAAAPRAAPAQKLIPFAADDEDDQPTQAAKVEPPQERPQFIRKQRRKPESPIKDQFNTTKDSKTTVSTNSNRKSTFLFGTSHQGGNMLLSQNNNLRYSQQNTSGFKLQKDIEEDLMEFSSDHKITEQYAEEQDQSSQSQLQKDKESLDNIMLESMQSSGKQKKETSNEYTKQFENNFMKSSKKSDSFKRNLIQSRSSLADSTEVMKKDNQESFYNGDLFLNPFPKADDWPAPGRIDFGGDLSLSKKSTPLHSDDEVTPRRGLDEMMSESKLKGLEELAGKQPVPLADTLPPVKQSLMMSQGGLVIASIDKVSPLKLQDTVKQSKGKKLGDSISDQSSACNLLDSSRKGESTNRKNRYDIDD